jgi:hypothetical protein
MMNVRGTVRGHSFQPRHITGQFCEHCAGGKLYSLWLREGDDLSSGDFLEISFPYCADWTQRVAPESNNHISYHWVNENRGEYVHCLTGEIKVKRCSETYLKVSFWCEFENGEKLEGKVAASLSFDAGYE